MSFNSLTAMHTGCLRKESKQAHHVALKWAKKQSIVPTSLGITNSFSATPKFMAILCIALLVSQPVQARSLGQELHEEFMETAAGLPFTCEGINKHPQELLALCKDDNCRVVVSKLIEGCKSH